MVPSLMKYNIIAIFLCLVLDTSKIAAYIDSFRLGCPPHAGEFLNLFYVLLIKVMSLL